MVNNSKAFNLAKYAIMFATIFVAMMIDRGISAALPISMAICVLLVTFSFCFIQNSWADGIAAFLCFGVASFIKAFIFPDAIEWYYKPLVYVIPRVLAGAACFGTYRLALLAMAKLNNRRVAQAVAMTTAIAVGLVSNTVFFLLPFSYLSEGGEGFVAAIRSLVFINILPEYLTSLLIAPWVVLGVRRGLKLGIDGNNWKVAVTDKVAATDLQPDFANGNYIATDGDEPDVAALADNAFAPDVERFPSDNAADDFRTVKRNPERKRHVATARRNK